MTFRAVFSFAALVVVLGFEAVLDRDISPRPEVMSSDLAFCMRKSKLFQSGPPNVLALEPKARAPPGHSLCYQKTYERFQYPHGG